jgi:hypothetical protein
MTRPRRAKDALEGANESQVVRRCLDIYTA